MRLLKAWFGFLPIAIQYHSSIRSLSASTYSMQGRKGWSPSQLTLGSRRDTPWTGCQFGTGLLLPLCNISYLCSRCQWLSLSWYPQESLNINLDFHRAAVNWFCTVFSVKESEKICRFPIYFLNGSTAKETNICSSDSQRFQNPT